MFIKINQITLALLFLSANLAPKNSYTQTDFIRENVELATLQIDSMCKKLKFPNQKNYPRTSHNDSLRVTGMHEWTSGFFPGILWYLYELTNDQKWKAAAEQWTRSLEPLKTYKGTHDLGFMMYCSFGNALRLAPKAEDELTLIESAKSLISRFNPTTKSIKSWNGGKSWDGKTSWQFPVIIDNLMNLELLFYISKITSDKKYYDIAVAHANTTFDNHFREDFSTYHVVDYDTVNGKVLHQVTAQGYSNNSTWARGQAWAIYGFTTVYRETQNPKFLYAAAKAANWYIEHLPPDLIPFWDFNVGQKGYLPEANSHAVKYRKNTRDASAAAIVCSALFELAEYTQNPDYTGHAIKMLYALASTEYRAQPNENANFIIKHCVGSIPHNTEIDKPLVYADYYFLEALVRYQKYLSKK